MATSSISQTNNAQHAHSACPKCDDLAASNADLLEALRALWELVDAEVRTWDDHGYEFPNADEIVPALKAAEQAIIKAEA